MEIKLFVLLHFFQNNIFTHLIFWNWRCAFEFLQPSPSRNLEYQCGDRYGNLRIKSYHRFERNLKWKAKISEKRGWESETWSRNFFLTKNGETSASSPRASFTFELSPIQTSKGLLLGFLRFERGFGGEERRCALVIVGVRKKFQFTQIFFIYVGPLRFFFHIK